MIPPTQAPDSRHASVGTGHALSLREPPYSHRIAIVLIILLGFTLRVVNLENSVHIFADEMHFVDGVTALWANPQQNLLLPMNPIAQFTWLYAYLQTFTVEIFGANFTGLRLVSVVFGTLTIPAVYALTRAWFDRPTATLAALTLATFPPHIHFSRLALNNIADPFFGMLALALFTWGMRQISTSWILSPPSPVPFPHQERRGGLRVLSPSLFMGEGFGVGVRWLVIAGVALGLTQYFYEGGKWIFPAVMGVWVVMLVVRRGMARRTPTAAMMGMFLLSFAVTIAPLGMTLASHGQAYFPRASSWVVANWRSWIVEPDGLHVYLREQFIPALLHLVQHPDGTAYYGGNTGLILPLFVPAFGIGLAVMLWRRQFVLPGIVLLTVLGNSLLIRPDWSARFVVALPALAIMVAVGVRMLAVVAERTLRVVRHHQSVFTPPPSPLPLDREGEPNKATGGTKVPSLPAGSPRFGVGFRGGAKWYLLQFIVLLILYTIPIIYYFGPHLRLYNQQVRPFRDHQDVIWRARDLPGGTNVFVFTDELVFLPHLHSLERYWQVDLNIQFLHPLYVLLRSPSRLPGGGDLAFFVQPDDRELLHFLSRAFDLGEPMFSPYNVPRNRQYVLYWVKRGD